MRHLCWVLAVPVFIFSLVAWGETLTGKVVGLSDGDTLSILFGESDIRTIRLSGVDCPDKGQEYAEEAKDFVSDLCLGKQVVVDASGTDIAGRPLGVVTLEEGLILNQELLQRGLAWHYTRYGSDPALAELESKARQAHLGLWGVADPVAPWTYRNEEPVSAPAPIPEKKAKSAKSKPMWWMYAPPASMSPQALRSEPYLMAYQSAQKQRQKQVELQAQAIKQQYGMGPVANQIREEIELNKQAEANAFLFGEYDPYSRSYSPVHDFVTLDRRTGVYHDMYSPWAQMLYNEDKAIMPRKEAIRRGAYPSSWDYNYYNYWGW